MRLSDGVIVRLRNKNKGHHHLRIHGFLTKSWIIKLSLTPQDIGRSQKLDASSSLDRAPSIEGTG